MRNQVVVGEGVVSLALKIMENTILTQHPIAHQLSYPIISTPIMLSLLLVVTMVQVVTLILLHPVLPKVLDGLCHREG